MEGPFDRLKDLTEADFKENHETKGTRRNPKNSYELVMIFSWIFLRVE